MTLLISTIWQVKNISRRAALAKAGSRNLIRQGLTVSQHRR